MPALPAFSPHHATARIDAVPATTLLALALGAALLSGCGSPYAQLVRPGPTGEVIVFQSVRVFTGADATPLAEQDVVVRDGRIATVAATGQPTPEGARVIPGAGRTLLPGFVDAHVHLGGQAGLPEQDVPADPEFALRALLFAGVTTVYDLGGQIGDTLELRKRVRAGEIPGPRIFAASIPITAPDSHPIPTARALLPIPLSWMVGLLVPQIDQPGEAATLVDDAIEAGADYIKIIVDHIPPGSPAMQARELKALIDASHARERRAVVHIGDAEQAADAARAGADVLAHGIWRGPMTDEQLAAIAADGMPVIYTAWGWDSLADLAEGTYQPTALDQQIMPRAAWGPLTGPASVNQLREVEVLWPFAQESARWRAERASHIKRMHDAGVPIIVGTDSPLPAIYPGAAYHREMATLVAAGVPPVEVLLGATGRAAALIPGAEFGVIAPGRPADLVLVEGDPLADIAAAAEIVAVVAGGRWIERLPPAGAGGGDR